MPPMANQGLSVSRPATARTSSSPGAGRPGLVGGGPARADAEVVGGSAGRGGSFARSVTGQAEQRARSHDLAGHLDRQVALAQVQHVGAGRAGDVGAVVHREQGAVPVGRVGQDLAGGQLVERLQRTEPLLTGRPFVAQTG